MKKIIDADNIQIDLTFIGEFIDFNSTTARTIIALFIQNLPKTIEKIKINYENKAWETLSSNAHIAKSSLSVIQINNLLQVATEIEKLAKTAEQLPLIANLIQELEQQTNASIPLLSAYLAELQ